jgi:hypothetical protein
MKGIAAIRSRNVAPQQAPTWWSEADSIASASEKIDLLAMMNCLAEDHPGEVSPDVHNAAASGTLPDLRASLITAYDPEEEKLYQTMKARFGVRDNRDTVQSQPTGWPTEVPRAKRTRKATTTEAEADQLSALDRQLQALKDTTQSVLETGTRLTLQDNNEVHAFAAQVEDGSLQWKERVSAPTEQAPALQEPFRAPSAALRQLVHDRLFLLDDHCMPCTIRTHRRGSGATDSASSSDWLNSKELLLRNAAHRVQLALPSGTSSEEAGELKVRPHRFRFITVVSTRH